VLGDFRFASFFERAHKAARSGSQPKHLPRQYATSFCKFG
jgi:hypothetical protein